VKHNIRVSGFEFEPFAKYVTHMISAIFCVRVRLSHVEGGQNPIGRVYDDLKPLGQEVLEKFFVTMENGFFLIDRDPALPSV